MERGATVWSVYVCTCAHVTEHKCVWGVVSGEGLRRDTKLILVVDMVERQ